MQPGHAVFEGDVGHRRLLPREHGFSYRIAHFWLDASQITALALQTKGISYESFGALSFRRRDYLDGADDIHQAVCDKIQNLGGDVTPSKVFILTPLANYGFYFSPLTLYYAFDSNGQLLYLLAEVTNTPWNERHYYLQTIHAGQHHYQHDKAFHVSPFHPMQMQYHWQIPPPDTHLRCSIENRQQGQSIFSAWISLARHELSAEWRRRWLIRHPWQNVQVVLRIYWHALRLLIKRVPLHSHPKTKDNMHDNESH